MTIQTGAGLKFYIGPSDSTSADATAFEAIASGDWDLVGEMETAPEFGDERTAVNFLNLTDGRTRKARGSADAGTSDVTFAYDPADPGQVAMRAAFNTVSQTLDEYAFKVEAADGTSTPSTWYFRAKVFSFREGGVNADGIMTVTATLGINSNVVFVEPT